MVAEEGGATTPPSPSPITTASQRGRSLGISSSVVVAGSQMETTAQPAASTADAALLHEVRSADQFEVQSRRLSILHHDPCVINV